MQYSQESTGSKLERNPGGLHRKVKLLSCGCSAIMINYILLYKIRKRVKKILKEKIEEEEKEDTTASSEMLAKEGTS